MPLVVIEPLGPASRSGVIRSTTTGTSTLGRGVSVQARPGDAIRDLCDEARAPVPFSCRSGRCGTCFVEVVDGADQLAEVDDEERLVLDTLGVVDAGQPRPRHRLACQAIVERQGAVIRLRVAPLR